MKTRAWAIILTVISTGFVRAQEPAPAQEALRAALASCPHRLVFETKRDGNWEIYLSKADGTDPRNLTNTPDCHELNPKGSPDGSRIAFVQDTVEDGEKVRDVYVMQADGTGRQKIADDARDPCWSPDGKRLAYLPAEYPRYTTSTWATKGLRIYDFDSGTTRDHPHPKLQHLYALAWSQDGRYFVASVHGGLGYVQAIVAIEVEGTGVHSTKLFGCRPDFSPDGGKVIWGYGDYSIGLTTVDWSAGPPQCAAPTSLVAVPYERGTPRLQTYHADWSPDARFVAFSTGPKVRGRSFFGAMPQNPGEDAPGWNLAVADAVSGVWIPITADGASNKEPDWLITPEQGR